MKARYKKQCPVQINVPKKSEYLDDVFPLTHENADLWIVKTHDSNLENALAVLGRFKYRARPGAMNSIIFAYILSGQEILILEKANKFKPDAPVSITMNGLFTFTEAQLLKDAFDDLNKYRLKK